MKEIEITNNIQNVSFLERLTIYNQILKEFKISTNDIYTFTVNEEVSKEKDYIRLDTDMHLLSIKKILLYSIPVISKSKIGITLTSSLNTKAILYENSKISTVMLNINDKFNLIGFSFDDILINNLDFTIFPFKYNSIPEINILFPLSLSHSKKVDVISIHNKKLFIIKDKYYEDTKFYNSILKLIYFYIKLNETDAIGIVYNLHKYNYIKEFKNPIYNIPILHDNKDIDILNKILYKSINKNYYGSYINILYNTYNINLYENIFLYGINNNLVQEIFKKLKYVKQQNIIVSKNNIDLIKKQLLETKSEKITRELYPYLFSIIDSRGIFTEFNSFALYKLDTKIQNNVKLLLDKDIEYQHSITSNTCEHLKILKDINNATDLDKIIFFNLLKPFLNTVPDSNNRYNCLKCSHMILCTHEYNLYELLSSIKSNDIDKLDSINQVIINKYKNIDKVKTSESIFTYYCKYCAKDIGKSSDIIQVSITNILSYQNVEIDTIKITINNSVANIISKHINILQIRISKKSLMTNISNIISSYIYDIYSNMEKNKTLLNKDELLQFNIDLYVLVCIIYINVNIIKNNNTIFKIGGKENPNPNIIKTEFKNIYNIAKSLNSFKLVSIDNNQLKFTILGYYKNLLLSGSELTEPGNIETNINTETEISHTSVYKYVLYVLKLFKQKYSFNAIINKDLSDSKSFVNIFSNIPDISKSINLSKLSKYEIYILNSYNHFRKYIVDGIYNLSDEYILTDDIIKYTEEELKSNKLWIVNPIYLIDPINSRDHIFILDNLQLIYCKSGKKHIWDYIFSSGKKEYIFTKSEISSLLNNELYLKKELKFETYKCQLCNIKLSNVSSNFNNEITKNINKLNLKDAFFDLYMISCPIKDNHIFIDSKCSQCNSNKLELLNESDEYFNMYITKFISFQEIKTKKFLNQINELCISSKVNLIDIKPYEDIDIKKIEAEILLLCNTISRKIDIKINSLLYLGASEMYSYNDIISNKIIPTTTINRYNILYSHSNIIINYYNYIKNITVDSSHYDSEFITLIKNNLYNHGKLTKLSLPNLPFNIYNIYQYYYPKNSSDIKNIDILLYYILKLIDFLLNSNEKFIIILTEYILDKIIYLDKIRSNYNYNSLKASSALIFSESDQIDNINILDIDIDEEELDDIDDNYDNAFNNYGMDIDPDIAGDDEDYDMDIKID
jgi:hypothetical protein